MRRILSLFMALLLMASFYVYALMRENEESKRSEQWLVAAEVEKADSMGGLDSADPQKLAAAMGLPSLLPEHPISGSVTDASYLGAYARLLTAQSEDILVQGVRPATAAPLIRGSGLRFLPAGISLLSYPLLTAQDEDYSYYYLVTEDSAAFVLRIPVLRDPAVLNSLRMVNAQ